ncbi:barstar family protein [Buchananella hordeovulneris]|uniref:barstar family protein n=1 Tax=Buchananella hordeovulneris TaxID=52770 RepID=UPI000F5DEE43|nr:barstar family protein [Buchananella hordeovulneris]RRD42576.1 hypothetical protein EII13_09200 [Buchananella hordeovulneris]
MTGRDDELRTALHHADWLVVAEEESTDALPASWRIVHAYLPDIEVTLDFDCLDAWGNCRPLAYAYGCRSAQVPGLSIYLGRRRDQRRAAIADFVRALTAWAYQQHETNAGRNGAENRDRAENAAEYRFNLRLVRTADQFFRLLSKTLYFPGYFGGNWAAADDCMRDLAWLPPGPLTLRFEHLDALAARSPLLHREVVTSLNLWEAHWAQAAAQRAVHIVRA